MPSTPTVRAWGEPTLADMRAPGVPAEAIDETWKDDIVERLLRELKRQLSQLEDTKPTPEIDQSKIRAENVRALASIERTLARLLRIQEQRALDREKKVAARNDDARAALERRLDEQLAAMEALEPPAKPEQ